MKSVWSCSFDYSPNFPYSPGNKWCPCFIKSILCFILPCLARQTLVTRCHFIEMLFILLLEVPPAAPPTAHYVLGLGSAVTGQTNLHGLYDSTAFNISSTPRPHYILKQVSLFNRYQFAKGDYKNKTMYGLLYVWKKIKEFGGCNNELIYESETNTGHWPALCCT